jgi:hypothetical protein
VPHHPCLERAVKPNTIRVERYVVRFPASSAHVGPT